MSKFKWSLELEYDLLKAINLSKGLYDKSSNIFNYIENKEIITKERLKNKKIGIILSGGNVDLSKLPQF